MFHSFCVTSSSLLASPTNIQLQFRQRRRRPKRGTFHYSYQLAASLIHWIDDRFFLSFLQYKKLAEHRKVNAKRWWWYDRNDQQLQQHLIQLLLVVFSPPFSADCTCGYFYYLQQQNKIWTLTGLVLILCWVGMIVFLFAKHNFKCERKILNGRYYQSNLISPSSPFWYWFWCMMWWRRRSRRAFCSCCAFFIHHVI